MAYVSSSIYALFWIKGDPMRIAASKDDAPRVIDRVHERIAACWANMDQQITPGRYILGDELSVLDLYVTVVSRFGPWRTRFYKTAPKMARDRPPRGRGPAAAGFLGAALSVRGGMGAVERKQTLTRLLCHGQAWPCHPRASLRQKQTRGRQTRGSQGQALG